jgi:hypothetical protein
MLLLSIEIYKGLIVFLSRRITSSDVGGGSRETPPHAQETV